MTTSINFENGIYTCEKAYENFEGFTLQEGFKVVSQELANEIFSRWNEWTAPSHLCTSGMVCVSTTGIISMKFYFIENNEWKPKWLTLRDIPMNVFSILCPLEARWWDRDF